MQLYRYLVSQSSEFIFFLKVIVANGPYMSIQKNPYLYNIAPSLNDYYMTGVWLHKLLDAFGTRHGKRSASLSGRLYFNVTSPWYLVVPCCSWW